MQSYKRGIVKHSHSEGKCGKVYIGDTLKAAIDEYKEKNPQNTMPPIECSGKTYSYRLLAAAGKELESSELLHRFYGKRSFHEIELIMSNKKYEFQQEIRRSCESLAEKFPHVLATADLWAAHEALRRKLCNRKSELKRESRKREAGTSGPGSGETNSRLRRQQEVAAKKAEYLVEARRRKAEQRKNAETGVKKNATQSKEPVATSGEVASQPSVSKPNRDAVQDFGKCPEVFESQSEPSEEEIATTRHIRHGPQRASDELEPSTSEQTKARNTSTPSSEEEARYEPSMVGVESACVKSKRTKKNKYPATNVGRDAGGGASSVSISHGKGQTSSGKKSAASTKKGRALEAKTLSKQAKAKRSTPRSLLLDEKEDDVSSMADSETANTTNPETKIEECPVRDICGAVLDSIPPVSMPRHRRNSSTKKSVGSKKKYRAPETIPDEIQDHGDRRRNRSVPKRYRQ